MTTAEIQKMNVTAAHAANEREWRLAQGRARDSFREFAGIVALHMLAHPLDEANNRAWRELTHDGAVVSWVIDDGTSRGVDCNDALHVLAFASHVRDSGVS